MRMEFRRARQSFWLLIGLVSACASKPQIIKEPWSFAEKGIQLNLDADELLNVYDSERHTLLLCVYQLKDDRSYLSTLEGEGGLARLVSCQSFGEDVVSAKRIIVNPAEIRDVSLDRGENVRFVAVVAGYLDATPEGSTRLYPIPTNTVEEGAVFSKQIHERPGRLTQKLVLGSRAIEQTGERIKVAQVTKRAPAPQP